MNRAATETVTLTIDDQEVTVPKGTPVLEAARTIGIDVPHFCYHPGLSAPAVCRQCLVEVEKAPKLVPSCYTPVTDGMVVKTNTDKAVQARAQMLEFTLVNHPIDCPICDRAGDCQLQKLYFDHDTAASRVDLDKVKKAKKVDVGPHIFLDQERCILCTRCIRVCNEVAGQEQLTMAHRGNREILTTAPGQKLDNPYSVNTVDVCPVGALTFKDFRFSMRAWELMMTPSICTGCATGCNIEVQHRGGQIYRLVPRENAEVNRHWMCDEGRFTYKDVYRDRLGAPSVDGLPASLEAALEAAAQKLQAVLDTDRQSVGAVLSAVHSNEDNYLMLKLARDFLGLERIYLSGRRPRPEREDGILMVADTNPNTAGARAIAGHGVAGLNVLEDDLQGGNLKALLVLGGDVPIAEAAEARARELQALIVIAAHERTLAADAHVALPAADWPEVNATITNKDGRVQRLHAAFPTKGQALPAWELIARLGQKLGASLDYPYPRAVFEEMAQAVETFQGLAWPRDARTVQLRFHHMRG